MLKQIEKLKSNDGEEYWSIVNKIKSAPNRNECECVTAETWEKYFAQLLKLKIMKMKNKI